MTKYLLKLSNKPAGIYLFKVNNRSTRIRCEICSKLTIKTYWVGFSRNKFELFYKKGFLNI